jgi:antitoxin component YwqK of YwqJK toxin-antitoxin module
MNLKLIPGLALALSGVLFGCATAGHHLPVTYETELRYWRQLPYPRVEKLMNEYDPDKADLIWICQDYYHETKAKTKDYNETNFPVVIDFFRDVFDKPTIIEIYKRESTPEGRITRKARISVLGQLEFEEEYLDGERHGAWYSWHSNGKIYNVQNYAHGQLRGTGLTFSPAGKILCKCIYREGKLVTAWDAGLDGKWEKAVTHGQGGILTYGENGNADGTEKYFDGECYGGSH